jgi:hypothetical protein
VVPATKRFVSKIAITVQSNVDNTIPFIAKQKLFYPFQNTGKWQR